MKKPSGSLKEPTGIPMVLAPSPDVPDGVKITVYATSDIALKALKAPPVTVMSSIIKSLVEALDVKISDKESSLVSCPLVTVARIFLIL